MGKGAFIVSDFEEKYDETLEKLEELVKNKRYNELKKEFNDLYPTLICFIHISAICCRFRWLHIDHGVYKASAVQHRGAGL